MVPDLSPVVYFEEYGSTLWVGNLYSCAKQIFIEHNIQGVVCIDDLSPTNGEYVGVNRLCVNIPEQDTDSITGLMDNTILPFVVPKLNRGKNVLVHCWHGVNRSVCVASMIYGKMTGSSGRSSLNKIIEARGSRPPHGNLVAQVIKYLN